MNRSISGLVRLDGRPSLAMALVIVTGLAVWAAILPASFAHNFWVYSWDSAAYLEAAQSLHAGNGLHHRVIHGLRPQLWEPLTLWPPGYPIMVAAVMAFGVPATTACLVVAVASAALSVVLLGFITFRLVDWPLAIAIVIAVVASNPFQTLSTQCLADSAYCLWALATTACAVEWARRPNPSWRWMLAAGLFAGAAFCTRNAGVALFAAVGVLLVVSLTWRSLAEIIRAGLAWSAGAALLVAPLLVRNLMSFGKLNPYEMPPSDLSLEHNIRRGTSVILGDMTTMEPVARAAFAHVGLVFAAASALGAVILWLVFRRRARPSLAQFFQTYSPSIFIFAYAALSAVLVVLARTQYRWGEEVSTRYLVQIYWALWICLAIWTPGLLRRIGLNERARAIVMAAVFIVVIGLNLAELRWKTKPPPSDGQAVEVQLGPRGCANLSREVGADQIVLSSRADLMRIHCDLNARALPPGKPGDSLRRPISAADLRHAAKQGHLWGVVIADTDADAVARGDHGEALQDLLTRPERHPEFVRWPTDGAAVVLKYAPA